MSGVFVAMSGGVDSSVAAALLLEEGHEVAGVTMQLWSLPDEEGSCGSVRAISDARRVCEQLGIPHHTLDFKDFFERTVVAPYVDAYATGRTPNPCVECNERAKFGELMTRAVALGADRLATGHYARVVERRPADLYLARGADRSKDQSYFLYRLTQTQLAKLVLPVGQRTKSEVRAIAAQLRLGVHDRSESQDLCFAPAGREKLVRERRPEALQPGPILDLEGRVLGEHRGLGLYTIGQRHGLALSGPDGPYYVTELDPSRNTLIVGPRDSVAVKRVLASRVVWHGAAQDANVTVQTRYRMAPVHGRARVEGDNLVVDLEEPVFGVAPGQAVVCYEGDLVLGGGTIERAA